MSYAYDMTRTTGVDTELASVLRLSVMRLARRLRHERAETSLTLTQLSALSAIDRHGAMTPGELAAHERVQPPSMTRVLAVLEERALVTRTPHPTDGRQSIVSATDAARALLREDRRRREAWLVGRLVELSEADRAALHAVAPILDRLAQS
jgi:DNA-binding MarR family transcriptional regulator